MLSKESLESQLELCRPGDLVCCMWTDASIGKTSTNGGVIDVPVRSCGIFVGVFGKRKHIILAQNSFEYAPMGSATLIIQRFLWAGLRMCRLSLSAVPQRMQCVV